MHLLHIPPKGWGKPHVHDEHETAIFQLAGESAVYYGESLENLVTVNQGDFVYIPPGVPHMPFNPSAARPCICILARTDPNEQESVRVLNHHDFPTAMAELGKHL